MNTLITRAEARALGLTKFYTGRPCKFGHISERYVVSWGCVACMRKAASSMELAVTLKFPEGTSLVAMQLIVREWLPANMAMLAQHGQRRVDGKRYLRMVGNGQRDEFEAEGLNAEQMVALGVAQWADL